MEIGDTSLKASLRIPVQDMDPEERRNLWRTVVTAMATFLLLGLATASAVVAWL